MIRADASLGLHISKMHHDASTVNIHKIIVHTYCVFMSTFLNYGWMTYLTPTSQTQKDDRSNFLSLTVSDTIINVYVEGMSAMLVQENSLSPEKFSSKSIIMFGNG